MAKQASKKGGGKLNRTETVTLRLDPKLRYLTEIAARTQRRSTSSFIEWAIVESLKLIPLSNTATGVISLSERASQLWDVDEPDRFVNLALRYPNLLTHEEMVLWKLVSENQYFWKFTQSDDSSKPFVNLNSIDYVALREQWRILKSVVYEDSDGSKIPRSRDDAKPYVVDDSIPF